MKCNGCGNDIEAGDLCDRCAYLYNIIGRETMARKDAEIANLRRGFDDLMDSNKRLNQSICATVHERDEAHRQFAELARLCLPEAAGEPREDGDGMSLLLTDSPLVRAFAMAAVRALKSGPGNYQTVGFTTAADGERYSLTIQREGGITPAQRITELETRLKTAEGTLIGAEKSIAALTTERDELRRKIGEWATTLEDFDDRAEKVCEKVARQMREEAGK